MSDSGVPLGLCAECRHARRITTKRGSTFLLCALSVADPRFPRYPRLPVLSCAGFDRVGDTVRDQPPDPEPA
jgi:hypothetical protein